MRERIRGRLTYANVMVTILAFMVLGGGAFAAARLPRNSVGTRQLRKNAVTAKKIKKSSVTTAKISANAVRSDKVKDGSLTGNDLADGTITGAKVADGSLTGGDIDQSSLTSVRASNVIAVAMNADCTPATPFPSGVSAQVAGTACLVTFGSNVLNCTATATVALRTSLLIISGERNVFTRRNPEAPSVIFTAPYFNGSPAALPVDLTLVC